MSLLTSWSWYELILGSFSSRRSFNPTSLSSVAADKEWFTSLVRQKCFRGRGGSIGFRSGEVCARLLSSLEHEEILDISKHKDFNLEILRHCIVYAGSRITTGSAAQVGILPV